ncbi:hypothetical protein [Egbenema bharatensis]
MNNLHLQSYSDRLLACQLRPLENTGEHPIDANGSIAAAQTAFRRLE